MGERGKQETASPCHALDKSRLKEDKEISPHAVPSAAATKDAEVMVVTSAAEIKILAQIRDPKRLKVLSFSKGRVL